MFVLQALPQVTETWALIMAAIVAAFIVFFVLKKMGKASARDLEKKRAELFQALDLLEKDYLKRSINQETFEKLFRGKQEELIRAEAEIQNKLQKQSPEDRELLEKIEPKKRHVAAELLEEKKKILSEMEIAKVAFMKRRIDSSTFQAMSEKLHSQLVEVQSKIQSMQAEENVKDIMKELKANLKEIEKGKQAKETGREQEIVGEIIEQLEAVHYLK